MKRKLTRYIGIVKKRVVELTKIALIYITYDVRIIEQDGEPKVEEKRNRFTRKVVERVGQNGGGGA